MGHWRRILVALVALVVAGCGATPTTGSPGPATLPATLSPFGPVTTPGLPASPSEGPVPSAAGSFAPGTSIAPGPSVAPSAVGAGSVIAWTGCGAPFECGTVRVPIDYSHPSSGSIDLALIRLPATGPGPWLGDLLTDPGGPGDSGVAFVRDAGQAVFSARLRAQFDVIGFDPRGVGASDPIECVDGATMDRLIALDPNPDTPAQRQAIIDGARTFDAGCEAHSGALLPFMSTLEAARDMDRIRAALGDPTLTYLGFSYGTFLGSTYANLYPTRVRAFVLDGAVDPTLSFTDSLAAQAESFEGALSRFLAACARSPNCAFFNGGQPQVAFATLMASIDQVPLPAIRSGDPRPVGPGETLTAVAAALYDESSWPILADGLAAAQGGDGSILLALADGYDQRSPDGTFTNIAAANTAVTCADSVVPTSVATYERLAQALEARAPWFGASEAYSGLQCAFWPFHPSHGPVLPRAQGAPPIVVIGTTGDPATPYAWAVKLAADLASGVLLTRTGEGHTAYGGKSACIDAAVDAYLISLSVPSTGTVCS
ncbi:MAG TPA: alpha/beta hydrolase [Candidatus Acidoferrales bacterium]|nr:alpha/beta hydrolase [Candidatus Acidoferrales bacterium]